MSVVEGMDVQEIGVQCFFDVDFKLFVGTSCVNIVGNGKWR